QGSLDKEKSIWRKRFLIFLDSVLVEEERELQDDNSNARLEMATLLIQQVSQYFTGFSADAQPRAVTVLLRVWGDVPRCSIQKHPPEATEFWENADLEKQLKAKEDIFDKKSQIEGLDVLCVSRSQKAGEYFNKVKLRLMKQAEMAREEEAGTSSGHKQVRFEEEKSKKRKRGDTLPNGTKIKKSAPMNLIPSDDDDSFQDDDDSSQDDDDSSKVDDCDHDYNSDDEEDVPAPEETLDSILSNKKTWILPSGKCFNDIVAKRISANAKAIKKKKRLSAVEKAILRYGASQIIDLSAHMKQWFLIEDREFIMKDYKALLQVSEMPDGECSFIKIVEDMVHKGKVDEAFKFCTEKHLSSEKNSYICKISKIYADFIYKSQDQADILDYNAKNTHTEMDVILKACAYIIEGLNKNLEIFPRWGESFCPLSRSIDHIRGRKCDVRFLSMSGVDVGEWEFSAKATASKAIGDRCRSARINQSILNGLLEYKLSDEQVKNIRVPFLQFAGTSGQMLVEDLVEDFYLVFPGP
ncbi:16943_t:CDS:2, partial [Funneliformis geosporum]